MRRKQLGWIWPAILISALWWPPAADGQQEHHGAAHGGHVHDPPPASSAGELEAHRSSEFPLDPKQVPDVSLVDQDGVSRNLRSLLERPAVALNFIFTTCTTVCPPMGAVLAGLRREMEDRGRRDVTYLSISIDPVVDTPERLRRWAARFGDPGPWLLLTGEKSDVDAVLKSLGLFTALKEDHAPILLLGDGSRGRWTRAYGLSPPEVLADALSRFRDVAGEEGEKEEDGAREYFTDTLLVDQHGESRRFFSDLMDGKIVVITSFFAQCVDSCPIIHGTMARIQDLVGDRLGQDVNLLSITVDPEHDTPARLAEYAERYQARPGWYFLTGEPENLDRVLAKLGHSTTSRESHKSIFLVGNQRTGLWKKAFALGPPEQVLEVVRSVVDDRPAAEPPPPR